MKTYTINLDLEPSAMWNEVITENLEDIKAVYNKMNSLYNKFIANIASSFISILSNHGYVKYEKELMSISNLTGIPFGKLVILQIMYELNACCTSAIYLQSDGKPVHLRTMDWDLPELKKLTVKLNFIKDNKLVFSGISWAGYIGVLTAMKPDTCSISLNFRRCGDGLLVNLKNLVLSKWPAGYLIRELMTNETEYTKIIDYLMTSSLVAPCYFVICGRNKDECYNIVRDRDDSTIYKLNESNFLIQTNIDPEVKETKDNILYSIERRPVAESIIKKFQKENISYKEANKLILVNPILNEETIYVCTMVPTDNYLEGFIV